MEYSNVLPIYQIEWQTGEGQLSCQNKCTYFSLFSSSLSSCRLRGLPTVTDPSSASTTNEGLVDLLNGVEVKQVFGLECGRSALTGVGFILLDGLDALKDNGNC